MRFLKLVILLCSLLEVVDGFTVKRTSSMKESVAYLTIMTRYLQSLYSVRCSSFKTFSNHTQFRSFSRHFISFSLHFRSICLHYTVRFVHTSNHFSYISNHFSYTSDLFSHIVGLFSHVADFFSHTADRFTYTLNFFFLTSFRLLQTLVCFPICQIVSLSKACEIYRKRCFCRQVVSTTIQLK